MRISASCFAFLLGGFLLASPSVMATEPVGSVERVNMYAYGTVPSEVRKPAFRFDNIYFGERIETVENGSIKINFLDKTDLYLGSKSDLIIDAYVYDPASAKESMVIKATSGAFRFVTGNISKAAVKIQTPVAVIGIRGTDISFGVQDDGKTVVSIEHGAISVSAKGKEAQEFGAGEVISIATDGTITTGAYSDAVNDI